MKTNGDDVQSAGMCVLAALEPAASRLVRIIVPVGADGVNRMPPRWATGLVVEVRDKTDANRQAGTSRFAPNQVGGKLSIAVKAAMSGRVRHGVIHSIHQANFLEVIAFRVDKPNIRWKNWGSMGGLADVLRPAPVSAGGACS